MIEYFPILKWRAGERVALQHLNADSKSLTPVIQVVDDMTPSDFFSSVKSSYNNPIYFDTNMHPDENKTKSILNSYVSYTQTNKINAYPIINYNDLSNIKYSFAKCGIFLPVHHNFNAVMQNQIIENILNVLKETELDIFLDSEFITSENQEASVLPCYSSALAQLFNYDNKIKKYIISLTSFPKKISSIKNGECVPFPRFDFKIFKSIIGNRLFTAIKNKLHYADYGVTKYTDTNIDFSKIKNAIRPKAKYTTDKEYWVLMGSNRPVINYTDLAKKIVKSKRYYGKDFSYGDEQIYLKSQCTHSGGNTNWVTYACSHHIAVVQEQLSKLS